MYPALTVNTTDCCKNGVTIIQRRINTIINRNNEEYMIKKILIIVSILYFSANAYSQVILTLQEYDNLNSEKAALKKKFDSLNLKLTTDETNSKEQVVKFQKLISDLCDTIKTLRTDLSKLKEFKKKKKTLDAQIIQKNHSIDSLRITINIKDEEIFKAKHNGEQKAQEEKENGKKEILSSIVRMYQKPFDELIKSITKESVARDMQLVGNNPELKPVLNDLQIYFNALELLSEKFDSVQNKNAQMQLRQIKRQSKLLNALKDYVGSYQNYNTALKETIIKLDSLDNRKSANSDFIIQKLKFNEIVTILTDYIYNYYDYAKYPYLSDIMLEIIKRKQLNADDDVTNLLIKLQ